MDKAEETQSMSREQIIEMIRKLRNDLIKDFLDERHLSNYLSEQYYVKEIPSDQIRQVKTELKEMLISPVDANHYESLIHQIRTTGSASLTGKNEQLFVKDVEKILKKYIF